MNECDGPAELSQANCGDTPKPNWTLEEVQRAEALIRKPSRRWRWLSQFPFIGVWPQ